MDDEASSDFEEVMSEFTRRRWSQISGEVWNTIVHVKEETTVSLQKVLDALQHLGERVVRACINQFVRAKALVAVTDETFQLVTSTSA